MACVLKAAFWEPGFWPKLNPFLSLCVCVSVGLTAAPLGSVVVFGVGTAGGEHLAEGNLVWELRTGWRSSLTSPISAQILLSLSKVHCQGS